MATTENKGLVERVRHTTAMMATHCSVPMPLWQDHSVAVLSAADEIEAKDARIRELEAEVERRGKDKAKLLEMWRKAMREAASLCARADAADARCRKLEEALETAADNFDEIAEAIDGLASAEDRPLGTAELIRAVATEARALLGQADGEEG